MQEVAQGWSGSGKGARLYERGVTGWEAPGENQPCRSHQASMHTHTRTHGMANSRPLQPIRLAQQPAHSCVGGKQQRLRCPLFTPHTHTQAHSWMANSSASAATVFSPPLSCSMSRKRCMGRGHVWG